MGDDEAIASPPRPPSFPAYLGKVSKTGGKGRVGGGDSPLSATLAGGTTLPVFMLADFGSTVLRSWYPSVAGLHSS